jgi:3-dehydroquinate dehydratase/shikimate dehydrogenase|tara:strand:- start:16092 stop:17519 length:1428 start_codon:yes stop_codon:yes gene_type:complete
MICIPITSPDTESALADIKKANNIADIIELRLDYISNLDSKKLIKVAEKPVIATNRRKADNGKFEGNEEERLAVIKQAIELNVDYVDIEIDSDHNDIIKNKKNSKIIISYHNFKETPTNIEEIFNKLKSANADIIKIVTTANKLSDNLKIIELVKKSKKPVIGLCMGPLGEISRILAPLYGSFLTFASLDKGKESSPGQIPAEILRNIYRINDIKPGFKIYGVIGDPISKSKGYIIHNSLFKKEKLNNIYLRFQVEDLKEFMENFSNLLAGFSVTMPHKQQIINYLNDIDLTAKKIKAVNTVVNKDGKLIGYNTDLIGAIKAIGAKTEIKNKNVTILGAGGAARAIAAGILAKGGKVTILNRTVEKAEKLAKELNCSFGSLKNFESVKTNILINATSIGMYPNINATPIDTKSLKNIVVFDAIYNPEKTKLLQEAEKNNCTIISGIGMFINQAAEQFKIWTNKQPDTNFLRGILK